MAEKQKISVQELEAETGLEGNTPAAESDAVVAAAEGREVDEVASETVEAGEATTVDQAMQSQVAHEEMLDSLDDNVEIMERELAAEAEEDAPPPAEDEDQEDEDEPDAPAGEDEEDEAEDEEAAGDGDAPAAEGEDEEEEGEEGAEEDEGADPMRSWVRENLADPEDRRALAEALVEEGVEIPLTANGRTEMVSLQELKQRAAGYAGQSVVDERMRQATLSMRQVRSAQEQIQAREQELQQTVETFNETINDPEEMGRMIREGATLDYLRTLSEQINAELDRAETNPQAWQLEREVRSMKEMLHEMSNGNGRAAPSSGAPGGVGREPEQPSRGAGADWGFVSGHGYPEGQAINAKREVMRALDAAKSADPELSVTYDAAVKVWTSEGRKRPIYDVAKALIQREKRDRQKRDFAADPPAKRQTGKGRHRSGERKPAETRREKRVAWEDIPKQLVRDLQGAS